MRRIALLAFLLPLAACGSHPLEGAWSQELPDGKHGITVEFQIGGEKMQVHGATREDGSHAHVEGCTYTYDEASMAVTVSGALLGAGKGDAWNGKVADDHIELSSPAGKLTLHKGDHVAGH